MLYMHLLSLLFAIHWGGASQESNVDVTRPNSSYTKIINGIDANLRAARLHVITSFSLLEKGLTR